MTASNIRRCDQCEGVFLSREDTRCPGCRGMKAAPCGFCRPGTLVEIVLSRPTCRGCGRVTGWVDAAGGGR